MKDAELIAVILKNSREIFNRPTLIYEKNLAFKSVLGFDSAVAIQFILAIEGSLSIEFYEEEVDRMYTMGDLLDILRTKFPENA